MSRQKDWCVYVGLTINYDHFGFVPSDTENRSLEGINDGPLSALQRVL